LIEGAASAFSSATESAMTVQAGRANGLSTTINRRGMVSTKLTEGVARMQK
jgi:hypothetical protein